MAAGSYQLVMLRSPDLSHASRIDTFLELVKARLYGLHPPALVLTNDLSAGDRDPCAQDQEKPGLSNPARTQPTHGLRDGRECKPEYQAGSDRRRCQRNCDGRARLMVLGMNIP